MYLTPKLFAQVRRRALARGESTASSAEDLIRRALRREQTIRAYKRRAASADPVSDDAPAGDDALAHVDDVDLADLEGEDDR